LGLGVDAGIDFLVGEGAQIDVDEGTTRFEDGYPDVSLLEAMWCVS
jgi:hypothetical protein